GGVGSAGSADGSGVESGAGVPCGADDASEPPVGPPDGAEPEPGGKPGTPGTVGTVDPPSSWPGTCTPLPRPGTTISSGGAATAGSTGTGRSGRTLVAARRPGCRPHDR